MFGDPGDKQLFPDADPVVKKAPDPGSATLGCIIDLFWTNFGVIQDWLGNT